MLRPGELCVTGPFCQKGKRDKAKLKDELLRQTEGREIFHFHLTRCKDMEQRVMAEIADYDLKKLR